MLQSQCLTNSALDVVFLPPFGAFVREITAPNCRAHVFSADTPRERVKSVCEIDSGAVAAIRGILAERIDRP
jgi:hypothetical protein